VAVKQLFVQAQQTMDDFLNEVVLVAAMKHRNLVKLKGCCLRKDQRLLVYEYVESGDVAQVIFGELNVTHVMRHASDLTNTIFY
jgi:serine/threonine protein kinase